MANVEEIHRLRERMQRMAGGLPRRPVDTHPALSGLVQLHAGGSYSVDSASLVLALLAGPSRSGNWSALVGVDDFGAEAARTLGVDLTRTVLVPDPGEHWLEVTAALVDVAGVVVVRPRGRVTEQAAAKIGARQRKRGTVLIAWGEWPRCEVRLTSHQPRWSGVGQGHGHLRARRLDVVAHRGAAPPRRTSLWFPAPDLELRAQPGAAPEQAPVVAFQDVG